MFNTSVYVERRKKLMSKMQTGIALILGNSDSSMNYPANIYRFRQDSNFLYFFGLDYPDFAGIIDFDEGKEILFGDDISIDDIIWMGNQPSMKEKAVKVGIDELKPYSELEKHIKKVLKEGRKVHYLPPYRAERQILLENLVGIPYAQTKQHFSVDLIKAVVSIREIKEQCEIDEMDKTLTNVTYEMYAAYMRMAKAGVYEREIAGVIEGISLTGDAPVAYPVILSKDGQILHNHHHHNVLKDGDLLLCDAGAESFLHYATDITRTVPVGGKFTQKQKDIYEIVLKAEVDAINSLKAGATYRDIHLKAAGIIADGLKQLGIMKGNVSDAVKAGAHAMFFPHGLGHQIGLDVHDMEDLAEDPRYLLAYISKNKLYYTKLLLLPGTWDCPQENLSHQPLSNAYQELQ